MDGVDYGLRLLASELISIPSPSGPPPVGRGLQYLLREGLTHCGT